MHILVTSPIPSHPQNHGNRARVTALCRALQNAGAEIHYVYGGLEKLTLEQELAMRAAWEHVHILPRYRASDRKQSASTHHLIDDWYVNAIDDVTDHILKTWKIDYCIANYVWFSRWLDNVPDGIPKLIDTHDIFADRHARLKADGLAPTWYSTTIAEETRGLNRADQVIAIQDQEAEEFRARTSAQVVTLGHFIKTTKLPRPEPDADGKTVIGYMASDNPINQQSLKDLATAIRSNPDILENFRFVLSGAICDSPDADPALFSRLGFVPDAVDFYEAVDLVINPNVGGTGLKIKSIEAMAFGKAFVSTRDAMIGVPSDETAHQLKDSSDIIDWLKNEYDPTKLATLECVSSDVIAHYMAEQDAVLQDLFSKLFATQITKSKGVAE